MPSLHIVNQSPYTQSTLADCLAHINPEDSVLLIEDAAYAVGHTLFHSTHAQYPHKLYVLKNDMITRGITTQTSINTVDYHEMITLTEHHHPIQSWF